MLKYYEIVWISIFIINMQTQNIIFINSINI